MLARLAASTAITLPGNDPRYALRPVPFIVLLAAGFVIGVVGSMWRSRTLVAVGIALIFCATVLVPLGLYLSRR